MIELAYDIASGATYKFNTAWIGEQVLSRIPWETGREEGVSEKTNATLLLFRKLRRRKLIFRTFSVL